MADPRSGDIEIRERLTTLETKHEERHKQVVDVLSQVQLTLQGVADNQVQLSKISDELQRTREFQEAITSDMQKLKTEQALHAQAFETISIEVGKIEPISLDMVRHKIYMVILGLIGASLLTLFVKSAGESLLRLMAGQ